MSKIYVCLLTFCSLLVGIGLGVYATRPAKSLKADATTTEGVQKKSLKPPVSAVDGYSLETPAYDFGNMLEGQAATQTISLKRPEGTDLRIGRLYSSCRCLQTTANKMIFKPGEAAEVTLNLHTLSIDGPKTITYWVEIIQPKKIKLEGRMTVTCKRVPAELRASAKSIQFGTVTDGKTTSFALENLTHQPVQVLKFRSTIDGIAVSKKGLQILPGRDLKFELVADAAKLTPGSLSGFLEIETSLPEHAVIRIPIKGAVPKAKTVAKTK